MALTRIEQALQTRGYNVVDFAQRKPCKRVRRGVLPDTNPPPGRVFVYVTIPAREGGEPDAKDVIKQHLQEYLVRPVKSVAVHVSEDVCGAWTATFDVTYAHS